MNALRYLWFRIARRLWPCEMCGLRPALFGGGYCARCRPILDASAEERT